MLFSLILATVNRTEELDRFLNYLDQQTCRDFELLVIDQNQDDRLESVLSSYLGTFEISHLHSGLGLSRARNVGLEEVRGDIVAFPDDDCWYPPELLESVECFFRLHPEQDGVCGALLDENGERNIWRDTAGSVDRLSAWLSVTSTNTFLKGYVVERTGQFDERLGLGAGSPWLGAEERDYIIRVLKRGFNIWYEPTIGVHHPSSVPDRKRAFQYGFADGHVLRSHGYPLHWIGYYLARNLAGATVSLVTGSSLEAEYYLALFAGRIQGWIRGGGT